MDALRCFLQISFQRDHIRLRASARTPWMSAITQPHQAYCFKPSAKQMRYPGLPQKSRPVDPGGSLYRSNRPHGLVAETGLRRVAPSKVCCSSCVSILMGFMFSSLLQLDRLHFAGLFMYVYL